MESILQHISNLSASGWLYKIFWAAVLLIATAVVARIATRALKALLNHDGSPLPSSTLVVNIARVVVWIIGGSIVLDSCFGVDAGALITALGVGGIALSLGLQDTLSNLIGGMQITFMGLVKPGDNIEVGSESGVVQDITWRQTTIANKLGETIIIPNSIIASSAVVQLPPSSQMKVPFAVTKTSETMDEVAARIGADAKEAANSVSPVTQEPQVLFTEITEYGFKGTIIMRIEDPTKTARATDAVVRAIALTTR